MSTPATDWREDLQPTVERLEALRVQREKGLNIFSHVAAAFVIIATAFITPRLDISYSSTPLIFVAPIMLGIVIYGVVCTSVHAAHYKAFKRRILPRLVAECAAEFESELEYSAPNRIAKGATTFDLFLDALNYHGDNVVSGRVGATEVQFSGSFPAGHSRSAAHRATWLPEYFLGLHFVADFNKHFQGETLVLPDGVERYFGRFGQDLVELGTKPMFDQTEKQLVRFEDPVFEREFVVYSDDHVEAHYLLSPSLMQQLVAVRTALERDIYIRFSNGLIHIAIPRTTPWLEPPAFDLPLTIELIEPYLDQLRMGCQLVDVLDLNTRIWSK